jgi:hypothetical protein
MRFARTILSARTAILLMAQLMAQAIVGLPAAAQQEVAPDHFDQKPAISQGHKPAPGSRQSARQAKLKGVKRTSAAAKAKDASAATPVLKASAARNQPQPR